MTATAMEKSSTALRKELDRRAASRETLLAEIDQAKEKVEIAMDTGDTAACVRLQGRLQALEGLRDQQTRLVDRLTEELAEVEAEETRAAVRKKLPKTARAASEELAAFDAFMAEVNRSLQAALAKLVQSPRRIGELRQQFLLDVEQLTGGDSEKAQVLVRELEEEGIDLRAVLERWGSMPASPIDRHTPRDQLEPFGWLIGQGVEALQRQEALAGHARERAQEAATSASLVEL